MKRAWTHGLILCLVALLMGFVACKQRPAEMSKLTVAVLGPKQFAEGKHQWIGATIATKEINDAGGILVGGAKIPIEILQFDTGAPFNVTDSAMATERAITAEKADLLIGGAYTEPAMAMMDVVADYKKIFLACGPTEVALTERVADNYQRYKYFFRMPPTNTLDTINHVVYEMITFVASKLREELGIKKLRSGIIADKAAYADTAVKILSERLPGAGIDVVRVWRPSPLATDLSGELAGVRALGVHMIIPIIGGPAGITYARQFGELQIPAVSVGALVQGISPVFWEATGGKANYLTLYSMWGPVEITERTVPFWNKFLEFGEFAGINASTYDALYVLKEAIERAETLDSEKIVAEIEKTDFVATSGRLVFTESHDVKAGPGYIAGVGLQWQDGELKGIWPQGYGGTVDYKLPPHVVEYWKGKQ